ADEAGRLDHRVDRAEAIHVAEDRDRLVLEGEAHQLHRDRDPPHVGRVEHADQDHRLPMRLRNSSRVARWSRNTPSTEDVTIVEFCFSTPRIIMHRWRASIMPPTPFAPTSSITTLEICSVSRSWSWRRRANTST